MVPEVDVDFVVGEDVDLEVAVDFAVRMGVATERAGAGSTMGTGARAEGTGAVVIAADAPLAAMDPCVALELGGESVAVAESLPFAKTKTRQPATTATPARIATSFERLRCGGLVWATPATVSMSISFRELRPLERTDTGPRAGGGETAREFAVGRLVNE